MTLTQISRKTIPHYTKRQQSPKQHSGSRYIEDMGQGTSRLNWVCSCEDGKFNLSATYEEQKPSSPETDVKEHQETKKPPTAKSQPLVPNQRTSTAKDTLLPIMDVESSMDEPNRGTKLRRTFSSCDLVYTKPASDSRRPQGRIGAKSSGGQQYRSHEVLSSAGSSSTNTESSGLSQSNSENSLNSTKSIDSKLHRVFGTSNVYKIKREQAEQLTKQKSNNNSMTPSQLPSLERKSSVNSTTSTGSTDRKSSIGDISSLSELLKKKKKDARRAEIVAAVTKRLYSARKKVDMKPETVEVVPEQENNLEEDDGEPEELKLCSRARARLQELSKKALHAHRGKARRCNDAEAQTDFDSHVMRVKEVAVSTEELYHTPQMFFADNRKLVFTSYGYPSMRQMTPWNPLPIMQRDSLHQEDSFSDDSLDSTSDLESPKEEKPSLWNVISISSGKHFKIDGHNNENDQGWRESSTQTHDSEDETKQFLQNDLDEEPDRFSTCTNDIVDLKEEEHKYELQAEEIELEDVQKVVEHSESCSCRDEVPDGEREDLSLQQIDRHLYTITENSEHSDCNDMTSVESYSVSPNMTDRPVTVIEQPENMLVTSQETCSCRPLRTYYESCPLCLCDTVGPHPLHKSPICSRPTFTLCEMCVTHKKQNHDGQMRKDKMSQTTKDISTNTEIRKSSLNTTLFHDTNRICRYCSKPIKNTRDAANSTNITPTLNTKTEATQYCLSHLPVDIGTQTDNTSLPNMTIMCSTLPGGYSQLLHMTNPALQLDDSIAIFLTGHSTQPIIMKPVQYNRGQQSDSVGVQTESSRGQATDVMESQHGEQTPVSDCHINKSPFWKKSEVTHNTIYQIEDHQVPSHQIVNSPVHQREENFDSNSSVSAWDLDNFSDEEDAPTLPRATVSPVQGTEAAGYQHWTEIKNLILGRNRNVFPYNVTQEEEEEDRPVQRPKGIKKKSVSWSDLSGCGALHTEMVFSSDHNLFDSSQVPPNKINKNSLLDVISTEPWATTRERRHMSTSTSHGPEDVMEDRTLHRRWSVVGVKELSNRQMEGKVHLSAFLREASALVNSLSQATRLLEKGRQLNTRTPMLRAEQEDAVNTVHNELWVAVDKAPYLNQTLPYETEFVYPGPRPLSFTRHHTKSTKNVVIQHQNVIGAAKECNINTQMQLDENNTNGKLNWVYEDACSQNEMNHTDCSDLCKYWHWRNRSLDRTLPFYYPSCTLSSPRAYRQHLVAIRRQIIKASLPFTLTK
ncbi:uncharacterized protein [Periplaneta americana]|uniref:uncharacterized protein isoform X1 n=1 Tax=Periplaneta americana TaxID=6978 RepID=UPI0037E858FB